MRDLKTLPLVAGKIAQLNKGHAILNSKWHAKPFRIIDDFKIWE